MHGLGILYDEIRNRVRVCDYLSVAQIYLQDNFLLEEPLKPEDIKPRLLGHWGTCHGINVVYASVKAAFGDENKVQFILGPGHGFPALQANLFLDGELEKVDLAKLCRNFSWPGGFPSHASPITPGVICEGGELGYALGSAYGAVLGHPEKTAVVLIGDGEFETATTLSSMNLVKLLGDHAANGRVLPILHLNGFKISGPTIYGRKSERELAQLIRGFGYAPIEATEENLATKLHNLAAAPAQSPKHPFIIFRSEKGAGGPAKIKHHLTHQVPLKNPKTDPAELKMLEKWLKSYNVTKEDIAKKEGSAL